LQHIVVVVVIGLDQLHVFRLDLHVVVVVAVVRPGLLALQVLYYTLCIS
jgi:hypothetical protein